MSDTPPIRLTFRNTYDDRDRSPHVGAAATTARASGYEWLLYKDRVYHVMLDGTYEATTLTHTDVDMRRYP